MDFKYYLADALREHSPGAVATALEDKGCFGYDQFGRIIHLTGDLVKPALSLVAEFYRTEVNWFKDYRNFNPETDAFDHSPMEWLIDCPNDSGFWSYGWVAENNIPNFTDSTTLRKNSPVNRPLGTLERENLLKVIVAMAIDKYSYQVEGKSTVPTQISLAMEKHLNVSYSAESISNHFKLAKSLIEPKKD